MAGLFTDLTKLAISALVVILVAGALYVVHLRLDEHYANKSRRQYRRQLIMLGLTLMGLVIAIILMPIGAAMRGQLLGLLGIVLSATIALSSTTLVGNAMASIMLRAVRCCKVGDYISIEGHLGRITGMDLLRVEIQTESRDLTTLPNLYMVTHPLKVMRSSGTIISVEVSLGYDMERHDIEELLLQAARSLELEDPFVQVVGLGDFAVTYRVAGLLKDIKRLIGTRSELRALVLDALHDGGVEIVSPTFMNTRALTKTQKFIPAARKKKPRTRKKRRASPDSVVFDKADQAESLENLREQHEALAKELQEAREQLKELEEGTEREKAESRLARSAERLDSLVAIIKRREEEIASSD